jgi:hypothetical protein
MKTNRLTENQIKNLVKKRINEGDNTEVNEILNFGNIYQGFRGLYKGEGYDYYRFLSKLKNRSGFLEYALNYSENEFNYLKSLYEKIQNTNFNPEKKKLLLNLIEPIITKWESCFKPISDNVKEIKQVVSDKLSNKIDDINVKKSEEIGKIEDIEKPKEDVKVDDEVKQKIEPNQQSVLPNQRNKGDEEDSNTPRWDDPIKEEIKRFKMLIK